MRFIVLFSLINQEPIHDSAIKAFEQQDCDYRTLLSSFPHPNYNNKI